MWVLLIYGAGAIVSLIIIIALIFKRLRDKEHEDFEKRKY